MKKDNSIEQAIAQNTDSKLREKAQNEADKLKMERTVKTAQLFEKIGKFWTLAILILIVTVFGVIQPKIFSLGYWSSTFAYMTEIILLGLGVAVVMIGGSVDLSVGACSGLAGIIASFTIKALVNQNGMNVWLGLFITFLVAMAIGISVGLLNGFVITRMKLPPFLTTIATQSICQGLSLALTGGVEVTNLPIEIAHMANHKFFKFATPTMICSWLIVLFFSFMLNKTKFGIHTYACGSNREALQRSGVDTAKHLTKLYVISGAMGALSGLFLMMRFASSSPLTGQNTQLTAIAAAAIGGVSSSGGKGKAPGVLLGALIISVVMTGLVMVNLNTFWQQVVTGVIIIVSVYMDQFSEKSILK